jgi:hypothetical protein
MSSISVPDADLRGSMPSPQGRRRRVPALLASAVVLAVTAFGALPAAASAAGPTATPGSNAGSAASPGTAKAVAGQLDLDVQLLQGVLGGLNITGPNGLDVPLANLSLGEADAPNANGDSANFTNSVVRVRDDLINTLHLPGPESDLIKADAVSGTARVIRGAGGYTQAYATVANLRLFLPLVNLPGASADNGILKVDLVSAQATCVPGQKPSASAKMPVTIDLLGQQIPVPLTGDINLPLLVGNVDVHLSPVTTTDAAGASAAVEARITVDAAGLAKVSGGVVLASASCTMPGTAAGGGVPSATSGTSAMSGTGTTPAAVTKSSTGSTASTASTAGAATSTNSAAGDKGSGALARTGASGSLLPIAAIAAVLVIGGAGLGVFLWKKASGVPPKE